MEFNGFLGWIYGFSPIETLFIGLLISPGMMLVIGVVFESRWVLEGKISRAFMPGDMFLAAAFMCARTGLDLIPKEPIVYPFWQGAWFPKFALMVGLIVLLAAREWYDAPRYPKRARNSPTKIYHDVVCYIIYVAILGSTALVTLVATPWSGDALVCKICMLTGILAWVGCLVVDSKKGFSLYAAHTDKWKPLWESHRIWW